MGLAPGAKNTNKTALCGLGPGELPLQVRVVHVCGCSMASDHIFGSTRATFFRIWYRILLDLAQSWARRAGFGPGNPRGSAGPGSKGGLEIVLPKGLLGGKVANNCRKMRKSAGKCGKVGETAKSGKRLSSGSGPLGARPMWPMGKKYF